MSKNEESPKANLSRPLLLVVEDDAEVRDAVVSILKELDIDIIERENGKVGLEAALEEKPDAILTDINMPIMSGLEMLQAYRTQGGECPTVVLSAFSDRAKTVEALRWGAHDFLTKPFDLNHLLKVVGEALALGQKMKEFEIAWKAHLESHPELGELKEDLINRRREVMKLKFNNKSKAG